MTGEHRRGKKGCDGLILGSVDFYCVPVAQTKGIGRKPCGIPFSKRNMTWWADAIVGQQLGSDLNRCANH